MQYANCGENVTLKMSGCAEEELKKGSMQNSLITYFLSHYK